MSENQVKKLRTTKLFEAGEWESGLGLEAAARIEALEAELTVSNELGKAFEEDAGQQRNLADALAELIEAYAAELIEAYEDIMDYGVVFAKKDQQDRLKAAKEKYATLHTIREQGE